MVEYHRLLDQVRGETRRLMKEEGVKARYTRIVLKLGAAQSNKELHVVGDYLGVVSVTGDGTAKVRLDHRHSQEINLREVSEIDAVFGKMFFTTDGAGGEVVLYIGGALSARLRPIQKKVSIRNVAGSDVDLALDSTALLQVKDVRFKAHTGGHSTITLDTPDTAEKMMAASTKVKWALIQTDLAIRYGFSSTVHRTGPIGILLAAGASLTLEYCDLTEMYFNNNVGAESPKLQIEYVEEI